MLTILLLYCVIRPHVRQSPPVDSRRCNRFDALPNKSRCQRGQPESANVTPARTDWPDRTHGADRRKRRNWIDWRKGKSRRYRSDRGRRCHGCDGTIRR